MTELRSSDRTVKHSSAGAVISTGLLVIAAVLFRVTVTNMLGAVGRGYFNSVFELFVLVLILSFACIPEAVARLTAGYIDNNRFRDARIISRLAGRLVLLSGIAGMLFMFIIAYPYAKLFSGTKVLPSLFIIAVAVVPCCVSACARGFYEGLNRYSASKLLRAVEIVLQCGFAVLFTKLFKDRGALQFASAASSTGSSVVFGTTVGDLTSANGVIAVKAVLGAVLGFMVGSFLSAVITLLYKKIKGDGITKKELALSPKAESSKTLLDNIFSTAGPLIAFTVLIFLIGIIDICVVQQRLSAVVDGETGFNLLSQMYAEAFSSGATSSVLNLSDKEEVSKYLFGVYGIVIDMNALFVLIAFLINVPFMRKAVATGNYEEKGIGTATEYLLKKTMLISMPAGFSAALLSKPVFTALFGRGVFSGTMQISARLLLITGFTAFIVSLSAAVLYLLSALNKTSFAVKLLVVAAVIRTALAFVLTGIPKMNIYGALTGSLAFFAVIAVAGFVKLISAAVIRPDYLSVFVKPAFCSVFCAFTGYCANSLLCIIIPDFNSSGFLSVKTVSLLISLIFAAATYIISLLFVKEFTVKDVFSMSNGENIAKTLEKYGFLG
ncbi:MAG: polysaccharide biosynthesis C-terminal domain-containing protein [Clostridia bacterium]|nr:polysaccharide biosynthesis C-terminal domain-containing protein [Clostridia bacterium]